MIKLQHACVYTCGAKIPLVSLLVEMAAFRTKLPSFLRGNQELEDSDSLSDQSYLEGQIVTENHNEDDVEHDIDEEEGSEDDVVVDPEDFGISQALKNQGSCTLKRNQKKKGRKSVWSEESINEVIDVICESDYYRKKFQKFHLLKFQRLILSLMAQMSVLVTVQQLQPQKTNKEHYVPTKKGTKKENANYLLKEAVATFNSFVAQDPTKVLIAYFREENALNRKHEMELAQMQMQMWQTILMATMGQQQNIHQPQKRPASTQASTQPNIHSLQNSFCFGGVQTPFEVERNNNDSEYTSWVSYLGQNDNN